MSELGKANETIMGLPRSGTSSSSSSLSTVSTNNNNNKIINNNNNNKRGCKRPWNDSESSSPSLSSTGGGLEGSDPLEPPTKLLCTSPPHGLCAEDVPQTSNNVVVGSLTATTSAESTTTTNITRESEAETTELNTSHEDDIVNYLEDEEDEASESYEEEDRDLLDEEDKDSGFIDSNSADNSSDDDMDVRLSSSASSSSSNNNSSSIICSSSSSSPTVLLPSCSSAFSSITSTLPSSYEDHINSNDSLTMNDSCLDDAVISSSNNSLGHCSDVVSTSSVSLSTSIALSIDLLNSSSSNSNLLTPCSTATNSSLFSLDSNANLPSFSSPCTLPELTTSQQDSINNVSVVSNDTTVTTSAYSGTVPTASYDPHIYPPSSFSPSPQSSNGIVSGAWSCNFYDANQPPTNKYMEIQSSKPIGAPTTGVVAVSVGAVQGVSASNPVPPTSQAIQCDANGKSYMELGSSSPYPQTYSTECNNYTTSPTNYYSNNNYSQQQPSTGANGNQYYRPNYSQYSYPNGENYPSNYEGSDAGGCSYGAAPTGYSNGSYPPKLHPPAPPRCASPFCDSTKASRSPCYQQQRLSVLNMSMVKLNRFSRFPDPSLHKSVLICNTLRLIERELENEGTSMNALLSQQQMVPHCPPPPPTPPPTGGEGPLPPMQPPMLGGCSSPAPIMPPPIAPPYSNGPLQYGNYNSPDGSYNSPDARPSYEEAPAPDSGLLPLPSNPGNCEPLPSFSNSSNVIATTSCVTPNSSTINNSMSNNCIISSVSNGSILNNTNVNTSISTINHTTTSTSSNPCEERLDTSIDWCSVLSLPSQSELDSLNNSEYCDWTTSEANNSLESMDYTVTSSNTTPVTPLTSSNSNSWKLPSLSAEDILKSFPDSSRRAGSNLNNNATNDGTSSSSSDDLDNLIDVAVES